MVQRNFDRNVLKFPKKFDENTATLAVYGNNGMLNIRIRYTEATYLLVREKIDKKNRKKL